MTTSVKAISLFSGMGGDSLGMMNTGCKIIAFNEFDKHAIHSHQLNFPDSTLICDASQKKEKDKTNIQLIPDAIFSAYKDEADIIFAGHPCFVAGTKILTADGYKNIEDVVLEDKLLTHTGKFQNINNLQRKIYNGDMFHLNIKYHCENTVCTEEHPFYTREKTRKWNSLTNKYDISYNEPLWKSAKELTMNDHFGMVINTNNITPEFSFDKPINQYRKDNVSITLNKPEYWFMMGYFVGDGWIQDTEKADGRLCHTIRFAINNKDERDIVDNISQVLPITDKLQKNAGKCKKFGCSDFIWYSILKQFGKYAHGKRIPEWVQDAPIEFIEQFVEGYKRADGCIKKSGATSFTTVSYDLAFGLQRLYLKLGYIFGVEKTIRPKTCVIQGRTVNQRDTYCVRGYTRKMLRNQSSFIENGYAWYPPFKIEKQEAENTSVYNFEVENDNSYIVANTIVHNCQGFSNGGKKLPDDPRNTLFREFARSATLIKPKYIIGENVDGLLSRKTATGENYIDVIVAEFEKIGYNVTYQVCHTVRYGIPQLRKRLVYVGIRKDLDKTFVFPEPLNDGKTNLPNLLNIIQFNMEGAIKIEPDDFDMTTIPPECILTDMENDDEEDTNNIHPYLRLKAKTRNEEYAGKVHHSLLSFSKRDSPIHCEIIDIRNPSKTIICTYDHQPRLFVPLRNKNGYYIRCILPDELKQIQGFPADFKLVGSKKEQIKQIGNAVPPPLIQQIVKKLIS
jgi:DNA (cytosine-5)-methyltransferase 1